MGSGASLVPKLTLHAASARRAIWPYVTQPGPAPNTDQSRSALAQRRGPEVCLQVVSLTSTLHLW